MTTATLTRPIDSTSAAKELDERLSSSFSPPNDEPGVSGETSVDTDCARASRAVCGFSGDFFGASMAGFPIGFFER
jgi:hypothetical protein